MTDGDILAPTCKVELRAELEENEQVELPELVDVVVVGAGVAGVATAFRATELGLSVLVLDRDDLLPLVQVWDYHRQCVNATLSSRDRTIPFPRGGPLVASLEFEDGAQARDLCARWMSQFIEQRIALRTGTELCALKERGDGSLSVRCRVASDRSLQYHARAVVLAVGSDLPKKLELAGDAGGIASQVGMDERFVGGAACVLGGGARAAESVLQILSLKTGHGDPSPVYWSFRTPGRPRLVETLDVQLEAALGAGRVVPLPESRAVAVLEGPSRQSVLVQSQPVEGDDGVDRGEVLEFEKERVVACIGCEPSVEFLESLGIHEMEVVDQDIDGFAVTPWYETERRGVFLVGDALSPAYIQTTDFDPDSSGLAVRDRRACFKFAMRDGVLVAEALKARFEDGLDDAAIQARLREIEAGWSEPEVRDEPPAEVARPSPPSIPVPPPSPSNEAVAKFVLVGGGGNPDRELRVTAGSSHIVHQGGELRVGPATAGATELCVRDEGCFVTDPAASGESLVRIAIERTLEAGSRFFAGNQCFELCSSLNAPVLAILDAEGKVQRMLPIPTSGRDYGREESRSVTGIDPSDKTMSRRHFRVQGDGATFNLRDWGSSNGTYVLVAERELRLQREDVLWVGDLQFRYQGLEETPAFAAPSASASAEAEAGITETVIAETVITETAGAADAVKTTVGVRPRSGPPSLPAALTEEAVLTLMPLERRVLLEHERNLLELLEAEGLATKDAVEASEKDLVLGTCGGRPSCYLCVVRVLSGTENLNEVTKQERRGLKLKTASLREEGVDAPLAECRLTCLATATGPVTIQSLGDTDV